MSWSDQLQKKQSTTIPLTADRAPGFLYNDDAFFFLNDV